MFFFFQVEKNQVLITNAWLEMVSQCIRRLNLEYKGSQTFLWDLSKTLYTTTVFRKSCNVFRAKPKEVAPVKLHFSTINKCFDTTQIYE